MIVESLDGHYEKWNTSNNYRSNRSGLQENAIKVVQQEYPSLVLSSEVPIRIYRNLVLYLDIYIQVCNLAIEVHGEQHFKEISHWHKNPKSKSFGHQQRNDNLKTQWCELNEIKLLEFIYSETEDEWRSKLRKFIDGKS